MLSVKGIFNGKTVELLEDVPYQNKVSVIVTFWEDEPAITKHDTLETRSAVECRQPYTTNVDNIGTDEEYGKRMWDAKHSLIREHYLRKRIAEGATNEELQKLIVDIDRIDHEFETNLSRRRTEAKQYADKKLKEWCQKHGYAYNPTDDLIISDFINDAIQQVREKTSEDGKTSEPRGQ